MTPEAAAMMRHNFSLCVDQMRGLADKAKSDADAATFIRGADTYSRLLAGIPERDGGRVRSPINPPPQPEGNSR